MKTSRFTCRLAHLGALFALGAAAPAWAQLPGQYPVDEEWHYDVGPTVWATSMTGDLRPSARSPVAHFENSFSDMKVNAGGFGVEARLGPWGILGSIVSIGQSHDSEPLQTGSNGKSMPDGTFSVLQLAGAWRLSSDPNTLFDLLAGVRYSSLDMDVNQPPSVAPVSCVKCHHNDHWTDGIAGFKVEHRMSDRWWVTAYADIGGGASKTTWQAMLGARVQFDDGVSGNFGYRVLSIDYQKTELQYNLKTSGIYGGVTMQF
jgi:opacity protein-like surface antigen